MLIVFQSARHNTVKAMAAGMAVKKALSVLLQGLADYITFLL
jgi:hypothetical protein